MFGPLPVPIAIFVFGVLAFFIIKSISSHFSTSSAELNQAQRRRNFNRIESLVKGYEGFTAEVIKFSVSGQERVKKWRLVSVGDSVCLKRQEGKIQLYAFDSFVSDLQIPLDSNIPRLFDESIRFEAYLGGRNMDYIDDPDTDYCSLIVFYKIDGVPPTKVNLHS